MVNQTRREFLFQTAASSLAALTAANTSVYLIGSAFKGLDGSLVAGAKACPPLPPMTCVFPRVVCGTIDCDTTTGIWDPDTRYCELAVLCTAP